MNPRSHYQKGFTLVELIVVIVVSGILAVGTSIFIMQAVRGYVDVAGRDDLATNGRIAIERMTREIRDALPNSIRIENGSNFICIEFLPIIDAGLYSSEMINVTPNSDLLPTNGTNSFHAYGLTQCPQPVAGGGTGVRQLTVKSKGVSNVPISSNQTDYSGDTDYTLNDIPHGASIVLTAPQNFAGLQFGSWICCDDVDVIDNNDCILEMNNDKTVTVNFVESFVAVYPVDGDKIYSKNETNGTGPHLPDGHLRKLARMSVRASGNVYPTTIKIVLDDVDPPFPDVVPPQPRFFLVASPVSYCIENDNDIGYLNRYEGYNLAVIQPTPIPGSTGNQVNGSDARRLASNIVFNDSSFKYTDDPALTRNGMVRINLALQRSDEESEVIRFSHEVQIRNAP
ncbi:prepilin-type N-terminal cleavage/methylation domain-containing protein [Desulfonatronum parangueonense]